MLKGKKVIAIGERDGVPGPVIAECLEGAGYEVVFQVTECFVWTAAGAMNFENQGVIKRLADQYGPDNLTVVLGNGEANGVEVFAETVTQGDPSYAGPLAGVALKIPVYHVLEDSVMAQVPEKLRAEKLQLSALVIDVEPMHRVLQASRERLWASEKVPAVSAASMGAKDGLPCLGEMKKSIDLVMFDLDGTLADTGRDLADAVNFTRAYFQLSALPDQSVNANVGRGVEHLIRRSLPQAYAGRHADAMRIFLRRYEEHLLDQTVLYPEVHQVLKYFRGKRRVVVSNKIERLTLAMLRGLGVADEFDAIFGGDSAAEKKPHPALLQMALEQFQVSAARALMVGDGDTDVEAGKRAGVWTCGVTYGLGDIDALVAAKPDILIDNLGDLKNHFC